MKRKTTIKIIKIILILLVVVSFLAMLFLKFNLSGNFIFNLKPKKTENSVVKPLIINQENLPVYLSNLNMIKELNGAAVIELRLYNFDSGEREWEESYVIKKTGVELERESVDEDVEVFLHSKYIQELGNDFCGTVRKAKKNGDFGYETKKSTASLLWKYKGMMKYKDCFG